MRTPSLRSLLTAPLLIATSKNPEDDDPVLAAEMERALKPYVGLVPPAYLETVLRPALRHALTENPVGKRLLDQVRAIEKRSPGKSGPETKKGARFEPQAKKKPGRAMSDTERLDIERPKEEPVRASGGTVTDLPLSKAQQALVLKAMKDVEIIAAQIERSPKWAWLKVHVDFLSIGKLARVDVARTYNASLGTFPTYANYRVLGAMLDAGRKETRYRHRFRAYSDLCDVLIGLVDSADVLHDSDETIRANLTSLSDTVVMSCLMATLDELRKMSGEEALAERELFARALSELDEQMAKLPEEERMFLRLKYWEEKSLPVIAPLLGWSLATAKRRHREILGKVLRRMKARGIERASGEGPGEGRSAGGSNVRDLGRPYRG